LARYLKKPLAIHESLQKLLSKAMLETINMGFLLCHLEILGLSVAVLTVRRKLMMRLFPRLLRLSLWQDKPAKLHKRHYKVHNKLGHREQLQIATGVVRVAVVAAERCS
jgi:hypothetical protein